ncbi:MAG: metalloregulator ArsR/SmtB family transcription factor [Corallococcus sp.]|nr:metalloregulator ArsR/SmtB family transcription factor [Corallococcus sp.]
MLLATTDVLADIDYYLPDKQSTKKIAQFFSIFADCSRVRLLSALSISPLCVTDVARILDMNQTTVSHQLKILRDMGVVDFERRGKILYYKICNSKINEILLIGVEYLGY